MKLEQMEGRRQEIRGKQMIISYVGGDMECVYIYSTHCTHTHTNRLTFDLLVSMEAVSPITKCVCV